MKLYVAETISGDCVLGVYSTAEKAVDACQHNADVYGRKIEFTKEYNAGNDGYEWNGYDISGDWCYSVTEYYLDGVFTD